MVNTGHVTQDGYWQVGRGVSYAPDHQVSGRKEAIAGAKSRKLDAGMFSRADSTREEDAQPAKLNPLTSLMPDPRDQTQPQPDTRAPRVAVADAALDVATPGKHRKRGVESPPNLAAETALEANAADPQDDEPAPYPPPSSAAMLAERAWR